MKIFKELIEKDEFVKELCVIANDIGFMSSASLVGGAIIDLIDSRTPKDYDLICNNKMIEALMDAGFVFQYETSTAKTLKRGDIIVQQLKTSLGDFDFTISQGNFELKKKELSIDMISLSSRKLIPVKFDKINAVDCLMRIPHYKRKGFTIPDETYLSLVRIATKQKSHKS